MEVWQSEQVNDLAQAIAKAQAKLKPAVKDCENPFFKSKYADLSSVWAALKPFSDEGIAITQSPMPSEHGITVDTQLTHSSGQWMRSRLTLPVVKADPQGIGSAITYARRYALGCMTGIVTDADDDGNAAARPQQMQAPKTYPQFKKPAPAVIVPPSTPEPRQEDGLNSQPQEALAVEAPPVSQDAPAPIIWNAGKAPHRGKDVREVDGDYLYWYKQNGPQDMYRELARAELDRRDAAQLFAEDQQ